MSNNKKSYAVTTIDGQKLIIKAKSVSEVQEFCTNENLEIDSIKFNVIDDLDPGNFE